MNNRLLHILLFGATLLFPLISRAETVSQKEASRLARTFFNAAAGEVLPAPKLVYNGKNLTTNRLFSPFYVYNHPAGGFVIIAADNKAMPVLGYSLKGAFSPDNLDEETKTLLTEYAKDIEYIRYDSRIPEEAIAAWTGIPDYIHNLLFSAPDYDPISPDGHYDWRMRPRATEFPGFGEYSDRNKSSEEVDDSDISAEEPPFKDYEDFVAQTRAEEEQRLKMLDEKINPTEPKLRWIGGGHFEVFIPEGIVMARLYNVQGQMVRRLTYRNTDTGLIDLDSEPTGFYFILANGVSGQPYGFKIYK
ncbi:MAG: hypothetical protein HDS22_01905 [Bacteroides sp.]|nr:hypothetical protein [Bacteroides sp.]